MSRLLLLFAAARPAFGTVAKAALSYRDHPLGEKSCAGCAHFIPAVVLGGTNHCTVVAGPVNANGYCVAWRERNPSNTC